MKKLILTLAAAALFLTACEKNKTFHAGDFTATYPKEFTLEQVEDNYPEAVVFILNGEEGQSGVYSVVYYSDEELDHIEELYAENDGIQGFLYNKLMEKFNQVDSMDYLTIEGADPVKWTEDQMCVYGCFRGTSEAGPWEGAVLNYLCGNALVSAMILAYNEEDVDTLMTVAVLKFDE